MDSADAETNSADSADATDSVDLHEFSGSDFNPHLDSPRFFKNADYYSCYCGKPFLV